MRPRSPEIAALPVNLHIQAEPKGFLRNSNQNRPSATTHRKNSGSNGTRFHFRDFDRLSALALSMGLVALIFGDSLIDSPVVLVRV